MALGTRLLANYSPFSATLHPACIIGSRKSLRIPRVHWTDKPLLWCWERRRPTGLAGSVETKHQQAHFFAAEDLGH